MGLRTTLAVTAAALLLAGMAPVTGRAAQAADAAAAAPAPTPEAAPASAPQAAPAPPPETALLPLVPPGPGSQPAAVSQPAGRVATVDGSDPRGFAHITVHPGQVLGGTRGPFEAEVTTPIAGLDRNFRVFVPAGLDGPAPTLVAMGGFASAVDPETYMGWKRIAVTRHVVVLWVEGDSGSFNAGRCCGAASREHTDDSAALLRMLEIESALYPQNPSRLYVTGFSNGAMMALRFACEHPELVAAVGVVAAAYLAGGSCLPTRPVPVMHIHGMRDHTLPYRGLAWNSYLGTSIPSVAETNAVFGRVDSAFGVTALNINLPLLGHGWPHEIGSRYDATGHLAAFLLGRHR